MNFSYDTAQMQLHCQERVSRKIPEGLPKIPRNNLCECSRFSTLSSLVSIAYLSLFIGQLLLLSCVLVANVLIPKSSCHYGAIY